MAVTTVAEFAAQLKRPPAALLEQLQSAGVTKKSPDDALTESDKERLLEFLRNAHGTAAAAGIAQLVDGEATVLCGLRPADVVLRVQRDAQWLAQDAGIDHRGGEPQRLQAVAQVGYLCAFGI